jgi:hypothetical protein
MYIGTFDVGRMDALIWGFSMGLKAAGLDTPTLEDRIAAAKARGLPYHANGARPAMKARGWSEEKMVDEDIAIEIDSWKIFRKRLS